MYQDRGPAERLGGRSQEPLQLLQHCQHRISGQFVLIMTIGLLPGARRA